MANDGALESEPGESFASHGHGRNVNARVYHDGSEVDPHRRPEDPWARASLFSRLTYLWPRPLLDLGMERPLVESDLPDVSPEDTSRANRRKWERIFEEAADEKEGFRLWKALLNEFFAESFHIQPLFLGNTVAKLVQAVALGKLVRSFEKDADGSGSGRGNGREGYLWAGVLALTGGFVLVQLHHQYFVTWRKGMRFRIAAVASIYRKSLRLPSTIDVVGRGNATNLASNDVERFFLACDMLTNLVWSPLQAAAILFVGWRYLIGPAFAVGTAALVLVVVPLQSYLGRRFAYYRSRVAGITDRRVTLVSQAVAGARVMKMSGYEGRFLQRIANVREEEVRQISKANRLRAYNEAVYFSSNVIKSSIIFVVHLYMGGERLVPGDVFAVMVRRFLLNCV